MYKDALSPVVNPPTGNVTLRVFNGTVMASVAATLDWYALSATVCLLKLTPNTPVNMLMGVPNFKMYEYPYARINVSFTGTAEQNLLTFIAIPDKTIGLAAAPYVFPSPTASSFNKSGDPFLYYGNPQSGSPVVRGIYVKTFVELLQTTLASTISLNTLVYVWLDGHVDSVDKTKIKTNGGAATSVQIVSGLGGQLLIVQTGAPYYVGAIGSAPNMVFEAGAFTRNGGTNAAHSASYLTHAYDRFVGLIGTDTVRVDKTWFSTGSTAPVSTLISPTFPVVPYEYGDRGNSGVEASYCVLRVTPNAVVDYAFLTSTPSLVGTQVLTMPKRGGSANQATRNGYRAIIPLTCSGHITRTSSVATDITKKGTMFKAMYATVQKAVGVAGTIYNIARDQWVDCSLNNPGDDSQYGDKTHGVLGGYVYDANPDLLLGEATYPAFPHVFAPILIAPRTGWLDGEACFAFERNNTELWEAASSVSKLRPSIRTRGGVYPLTKTQGPGNMFSSIQLDRYWSAWLPGDPADGYYPQITEFASKYIPSARCWQTVSAVMTLTGGIASGGTYGVSFTNEQEVRDFYDLLVGVFPATVYFREYSGPFVDTLLDPPRNDDALDVSKFTAIATIAMSNATPWRINVKVFASYYLSTYSASYSYTSGDKIYMEHTLFQGAGTIIYQRLYTARRSGILIPPGDGVTNADWTYDGPNYTGFPYNIYVTGSAGGVTTLTDRTAEVGHYAAVPTRPTVVDTQLPSAPQNSIRVNCSVYFGINDYPLHLTALRDSNGVYEGRIWTGEPVVPFLA